MIVDYVENNTCTFIDFNLNFEEYLSATLTNADGETIRADGAVEMDPSLRARYVAGSNK